MAAFSGDVRYNVREDKNYDQENGDVTDDNISQTPSTLEYITSDTAPIIDIPVKTIIFCKCEIQEEFRNIIVFSILFSASVTIALVCTIFLGPPQVYPHGAISSHSLECSKLGSKLLKSGANPIDVVVSVAVCESILNPVEHGLGGCGVLVLHDQRNNRTSAVDFACSTINYKNRNPTVEIPTILRGLALVHEKFGYFKWADVLKPVLNLFDENTIQIPGKSELRQLLTDISQYGIERFYEGFMADEIVYAIGSQSSDVKNEFNQQDLSAYRAKVVAPLRSYFHGKAIETLAGRASLSMLLLLDTMQSMTSSGKTSWNSTELYHYYIETIKMVEQSLTTNYPAIYGMDDNQRKLHSNYLATFIKNETSPSSANSSTNGFHGNTTSDGQMDDSNDLLSLDGKSNGSLITIIGPNDGLISFSMWSNSEGMLMTKSLKLVLNRRESTLKYSEYYTEDYITVIIIDTVKPCGWRLAISGSSYQDVAQVIINILSLQLNQSEAVDRPRLYLIGGKNIYYEEGFPKEIINMLQNKGHTNLFHINKVGKSRINSGNSRAVSIVWKNLENADTCSDSRDTYGAFDFK